MQECSFHDDEVELDELEVELDEADEIQCVMMEKPDTYRYIQWFEFRALGEK